MADILVLHGPNLNLLGTREPAHYGSETLTEINVRLEQQAKNAGASLSVLQSNAEHELIEAVHGAASTGVRYIVINPAAYTHTSVALRDALLATAIPFIEVHLSNVHARDEFRRSSFFSDVALGVISGLGGFGYDCALAAVLRNLNSPTATE